MNSQRSTRLVAVFVMLLVMNYRPTVGLSRAASLRKSLAHAEDPGPGVTVAASPANTVQAIQSKYDHDTLHLSHKALGTRSARGGRGDGHASACDRSGGKCALCAMTRGSWCEDYYRQERVSWSPAPRGSKDCPGTKWGACNGVGNCHYDIGVCQCPAGWQGDACNLPQLRPCTDSHKDYDTPLDVVKSSVGPDGMDLDLSQDGWTASRCGGRCDIDRASCWCPANTTYGRKPPPPGSPPWVRYSQRGRPILESCKPGMVYDGKGKVKRNGWGSVAISLRNLWGEKGWCNAETVEDVPKNVIHACGGWRGCQEEGLHGPLCNVESEETCLNQCSGHGECDAGYCRCHTGWYGHECARKKAGEELEPGDEESRPWLEHLVMPVPAAATVPPPIVSTATAAGGPSELPGRLRPLIYIYDMPPEYTSRMHQYKLVNDHCGYRQFGVNNRSQLFADGYSVEVYFHEMLAISPHRTFDPEEADFFYVPVYYTCWMWPVNGWADMPFWGAPTSWHRYSNAAMMWLAAKKWLQSTFPFWDRRGGKDHIWMTNHDEGACYMPTEIYNSSIMLTHWGRLDLHHASNTAYGPDNYTEGIEWPGVLGGANVRTIFDGHPCYDPSKDLVIPGFKPPEHYHHSPLLGAMPYKRDILLYLRGDIGKHRMPNYSRGIRQKLFKLTVDNGWSAKHRIFVGEKGDIVGGYGHHLSRSLFCAVVPGDGYAMRFEDAVLHGCIPLIIMDRTHAVFESVLDLDSFSLRINEAAVDEHLPSLLKAISTDQIERMQRRMALVWHRFAYGHGPLVHSAIRAAIQRNADGIKQDDLEVPADYPYQPVHTFPVHTDAFSTILQWLHSRIPDTRGPNEAAAVAEETQK